MKTKGFIFVLIGVFALCLVLLFLAQGKEKYIVLSGIDKQNPYYSAALKLASFRKGEIIFFDPENVDAIKEILVKKQPRYVAVVVEPQDMDVNLLRRILLLSTQMDDDPFCDFAFGFITGKTFKDAVDFVKRIITFSDRKIPLRWIEANVISAGGKSFVSEGPDCELLSVAGFKRKSIYWAIVEDDPEVMDFVKKHINELSGGGVVSFSGCGDPEGIWLFSDRRNLDESKHWNFSPEKVGYDPKGEMPRITAKDLAGVSFSDSVVWSGVCHNGAVKRCFVESDIVSTFGKVENITEYIIPDGKSICLTILKNGVLAYIAAIGPNHGFRSIIEQIYALERGIPLGDVMRLAYHDMVMACEGDMSRGFGFYEIGKPLGSDTIDERFWSSPHNRLLYGDPTFTPFTPLNKTAYNTKIKTIGKNRLKVECVVENEWAEYLAWNMFTINNDKFRVYTQVEIPKEIKRFNIKAISSQDKYGKKLPISSSSFLIEKIDRKYLLHFQLTSPDERFGKVGTVFSFEIVYE